MRPNEQYVVYLNKSGKEPVADVMLAGEFRRKHTLGKEAQQSALDAKLWELRMKFQPFSIELVPGQARTTNGEKPFALDVGDDPRSPDAPPMKDDVLDKVARILNQKSGKGVKILGYAWADEPKQIDPDAKALNPAEVEYLSVGRAKKVWEGLRQRVKNNPMEYLGCGEPRNRAQSHHVHICECDLDERKVIQAINAIGEVCSYAGYTRKERRRFIWTSEESPDFYSKKGEADEWFTWMEFQDRMERSGKSSGIWKLNGQTGKNTDEDEHTVNNHWHRFVAMEWEQGEIKTEKDSQEKDLDDEVREPLYVGSSEALMKFLRRNLDLAHRLGIDTETIKSETPNIPNPYASPDALSIWTETIGEGVLDRHNLPVKPRMGEQVEPRLVNKPGGHGGGQGQLSNRKCVLFFLKSEKYPSGRPEVWEESLFYEEYEIRAAVTVYRGHCKYTYRYMFPYQANFSGFQKQEYVLTNVTASGDCNKYLPLDPDERGAIWTSPCTQTLKENNQTKKEDLYERLSRDIGKKKPVRFQTARRRRGRGGGGGEAGLLRRKVQKEFHHGELDCVRA